MTLNPDLLADARSAGARLEAAEKQALVGRGDYHTAIRRLHLAGASLREIAEALSLSHQRVQQIVRDAGGTWWSRAWRSRRHPPEALCSWCGRPPAEVNKLIAGPGVFICDACVASAEAAVAGRPHGPFRAGRKSLGARCAFCGKHAHVLGGRVRRAGQGPSRAMAAAGAGHVCGSCLRACREILDSSASSA